MLVKVGRYYLTIGTFTYSEETNQVLLSGGEKILLSKSEFDELGRILDEYIADQATLKQQIAAVQAQGAELAARMQQVAAYEQQLNQAAEQLQRQKSPVWTPGKK